MKKFLVACSVFVVALAACDGSGPTRPTPPPSPPVAPAPPPPTTTTPPTTPTAPTSRSAKDSFDMRVLANDGDVFRVEATNVTNENINLRLSCYEGPPNDPPSQEFFSTGGSHSVGSGSTAVFECVVACGQGQADLHEGSMLDPPVGFGRSLAMGRATMGKGSRCAPPPPACNTETLLTSAQNSCGELGFELDVKACTFECNPPPVCNVEELAVTANRQCGELGFELDVEVCTFECKPPPPTCEELNPPSASGFVKNVGSSYITSSFTAHNEGEWFLTLYAGSRANPRQYRKAHDSAELDCGESEKLSISYRHKGHSSCLWTLKASGPGISFNQVVLNRCHETKS